MNTTKQVKYYLKRKYYPHGEGWEIYKWENGSRRWEYSGNAAKRIAALLWKLGKEIKIEHKW